MWKVEMCGVVVMVYQLSTFSSSRESPKIDPQPKGMPRQFCRGFWVQGPIEVAFQNQRHLFDMDQNY